MTKVQKTPLLKTGEFTVKDIVDLNFFDLLGEKAKTKGTSNKTYFMEIDVSTTSNKTQIYSMWGPTGGNQTKDWRYYDSYQAAKKDFDKIVKSKKRKGYEEIDVAQRVYGSDEAKKIIKAVILTGTDIVATKNIKSSLDPKVQYLISELFGNTQKWVSKTLKCPLGQLTNDQIDKGRNFLKEAKTIINGSKSLTKLNKNKIEELTNEFYKAIPHNLGVGSRGKMTHLLLDDAIKIAQKEADLDTLLDAKSVGAVLQAGSLVDDQYKSLNANIEYINPNDYLFKWIKDLVIKTKASNHRNLNNIKLLNVWKLSRHNKSDIFLKTTQNIAETCSGQVIPSMYKKLTVDRREDTLDDKLYKKANVLPLFHGTRTENIIGITKLGLLIRPHNVILCGSMYGNGIYNGFSTKAMNYTSIRSSYWTRGNSNKAYLFITDTALGTQKIARGAYHYTKNGIRPCHSVWAKGGTSGVINDEFITYDSNQVLLRYLIEFSC